MPYDLNDPARAQRDFLRSMLQDPTLKPSIRGYLQERLEASEKRADITPPCPKHQPPPDAPQQEMDEQLQRELAYRAQSDPMIAPAIKADLLKRLAERSKPDPQEK